VRATSAAATIDTDLARLVRDFVEKEVFPLAARTDREHRFPAEAISKAAQLGLLGITVPKQYGGAGMDRGAMTVLIEGVARVCASTAVVLDVHTVAIEPLLTFGSAQQKSLWLPRLAAGDILGGFALTEPGAGSDAASLTTVARRVEGGYVLNGGKIFTSNLGRAGVYLVMARTGGEGAGGISAFLVDSGSTGLTFGEPFQKMGLNGSPTGEVFFTDLFVPEEGRLGREGEGFRVALAALDVGRIGIAAQAVGIAQGALDDALPYARQREQFGQAIATFQGIQFMLADMATRIEAARLMVQTAAHLCDAGRPFTREASMAKLFATDMAMDVTTDAVQILGGYGFIEEFPVARRMRDAKALQIYEGTNQIQRVVIARQLLR